MGRERELPLMLGARTDFALLRYSTWNLGDEIQSVAARQFLPRVDRFVDRDRIGSETARLPNRTRLIMNGWWMHGGDWPPDSERLDALVTSVFLETRHEAPRNAFLSPAGIDFLRSNGPIGARDRATMSFLTAHGIPAYFSGCLTLTLHRDPQATIQDYVVAVDLPPAALSSLRARTARPVVALSSYHEPSMSMGDRFTLAELHLLFLQSAACVVTTRLHAFLPSLALETPVLLVTSDGTYDPSRFGGLSDLGSSCSPGEFIGRSVDFDIDDPPPNPQRHLGLRESLISQCAVFTGQRPTAPAVARRLTEPKLMADLAGLLGNQVMRAREGREFRDSMTPASLRARVRAALRLLLGRIDGLSDGGSE